MSCHADEQEAIRRGLDGFRFFGYSLGYVGIFGDHRPGVTNIWQRFLEVKDRLPDNAGRGGIGTPDQVRAHLKGYEDAGVDQVIFVQQSGNNRHEHICESLELFAAALLPEFKARDAVREARKQAELAPYVAQALARKPRMAPIDPADIPVVESFGRRGGGLGAQVTSTFASDRGGAISIPAADLACGGGGMLRGISAITLATHDMARAVAFYQALGFVLKYGGPAAHFSSFHAGTGYLNLTQMPAERQWSWWGRAIFYVDDVDAQHARAVAAGLSPEFAPRDAAWGERYFHIIDPDGHEDQFRVSAVARNWVERAAAG